MCNLDKKIKKTIKRISCEKIGVNREMPCNYAVRLL